MAPIGQKPIISSQTAVIPKQKETAENAGVTGGLTTATPIVTTKQTDIAFDDATKAGITMLPARDVVGGSATEVTDTPEAQSDKPTTTIDSRLGDYEKIALAKQLGVDQKSKFFRKCEMTLLSMVTPQGASNILLKSSGSQEIVTMLKEHVKDIGKFGTSDKEYKASRINLFNKLLLVPFAKDNLIVSEANMHIISHTAMDDILDKGASKKEDSGAWFLYVLLNNGNQNTNGDISKDTIQWTENGKIESYNKAEFTTLADKAFEFFSEDKNYKFKTKAQILKSQNITNGPKAKVYWGRNKEILAKYTDKSFSELDNKTAIELYNSFVWDLLEANVIETKDLKDKWFKWTDESEKFEAIMQSAADKVKEDPTIKEKTINELLDEDFAGKMQLVRNKIIAGKEDEFKLDSFSASDVSSDILISKNIAKGSATENDYVSKAKANLKKLQKKIPEKDLTENENIFKKLATEGNNLLEELYSLNYGENKLSENGFYTNTLGDSQADAVTSVKAGLAYLEGEIDASTSIDDVITGLRKAMNGPVTSEPKQQAVGQEQPSRKGVIADLKARGMSDAKIQELFAQMPKS